MRRRLAALALFALLSLPAAAEPPGQSARLSFTVYAAGLHVLTIDTEFSLSPTAYRVDTLFRTAGVAGFLHPGEQLTVSTGRWQGLRAVPEFYQSIGHWSGDPRRVVIDYGANPPALRELVLAPDAARTPVPPALLAGSGNLLSAFAEMIRAYQSTGRCETHLHAFDGRILTDLSSRSDGVEQIDNPAYRGPALRCDYVGYPIAGLPADASAEERAKPVQKGAIWLGRVLPGFPPLPVQMSFLTRWFGEVTAHLAAAAPEAAMTLTLAQPHS
ncbi:MAG TPA: DUF3108 domain-containing protein [Acetobacteraceae bacterium]|nr:DUF3108 domain-containing protein [Acetobacteraceae bacterium]